jgi:hypothetical protein
VWAVAPYFLAGDQTEEQRRMRVLMADMWLNLLVRVGYAQRISENSGDLVL